MQTLNLRIRPRPSRDVEPANRNTHPQVLLDLCVSHPRKNRLRHRVRQPEPAPRHPRHDIVDIALRGLDFLRLVLAVFLARLLARPLRDDAPLARSLALLLALLLVLAVAEPPANDSRDSGGVGPRDRGERDEVLVVWRRVARARVRVR